MQEAAAKDVRSPWNCRWARLAQQLVVIPEQEPARRSVGVCAAASRPPYGGLRSTLCDRGRMRWVRVLGIGRDGPAGQGHERGVALSPYA